MGFFFALRDWIQANGFDDFVYMEENLGVQGWAWGTLASLHVKWSLVWLFSG